MFKYILFAIYNVKRLIFISLILLYFIYLLFAIERHDIVYLDTHLFFNTTK